MSKNFKPLNKEWLIALMAASLAACGGGGGGGGDDPPQGGNPPAPTPAPPPPPPPPPPPASSNVPPLSATVVDVSTGTRVGERYFENGNTSSGGQGSPVNDIQCHSTIPDDTHTHISIILNGDHLSFPDLVGTPGSPRCYYGIHTRDGSGLLHVEIDRARAYTLGDLFDIWGQPLTTTNVAGLQGMPIEVFVTDAGTVTRIETDWRAIELQSKRLITIGVGTPLTEIPNITWQGD